MLIVLQNTMLILFTSEPHKFSGVQSVWFLLWYFSRRSSQKVLPTSPIWRGEMSYKGGLYRENQNNPGNININNNNIIVNNDLPRLASEKPSQRAVGGQSLSSYDEEILLSKGIEITDHLGEGYFGNVWRGIYTTTGKKEDNNLHIYLYTYFSRGIDSPIVYMINNITIFTNIFNIHTLRQ